MKFLKRLFTIPNIRLPAIKFKSRDWQTPKVDVGMPNVMNVGKVPDIKVPSLKGTRIVGGVWKVGTFGVIIGILVTGFAIGTAIRGLNAAPIWPEPASYNAAAVEPDRTLQVGDEWVFADTTPADERELQTHTLQLNVSGARAADITISGLEIGKASGLTDAIQIIGTADHVLACDTVIIDNVEATTFNLAATKIYQLNITNVAADGLSIGPTLSSTPKDITVTSTRGAVKIPGVTNGSFDKIVISTATADSFCRTLTLSNISAFGGGINLDNMEIGTLTIQNSKIGNGTGIDAPSFIIDATTLIQSMSASNNYEAPITVQ